MAKFTLLWIFTAALGLMFTQNKSSLCPTTKLCDCDKERHTAFCTKRYPPLTSIPDLPSYVYHIVLNGNYFPNISKNTFSSILRNHIMSISLSDTKLQHIDPDAFEALNHLQSLDLSRNKYINIMSLKRSLFSLRNHNLKSLSFNGIGWKDSSMKIFSGIHRNITKISISANPLLQFSNEAFSGLEDLFSLVAHNNRLGACDEGLTKLHSLLELDFFANNISVCNTNNLPKTLQILKLRWNKLSSVPDFCSFNMTSTVPNLQSLDLSGNRIRFITNHSFDCLHAIESIDMTNNSLELIQSKSFYYLNSLQDLSLSKLERIFVTIETDSFNIPSLKCIYFEQITFIPNVTKCTHLETVYFFNSDLSNEASEAKMYFGLLPELKTLYLVEVKWISIPNGFFKLFPNLEYINLNDNGIKTIRRDLFLEQSKIKSMMLSENRISHIGDDTFPPSFWQNIEKFDLSGNPFACDCSLLWFRDKFKASPDLFQSTDLHYECISPSERVGLKLRNFNLTSFQCKQKSEIVTALVSSGSIVVVVVISFLVVYKGRWHIRYWIYLLRYRRSDDRQLSNVDLQYDAFVIYADEDSEFVHKILLPKLEDEENVKLCIHFRDFQPGKIIVDNIVESMGKSRMAIVVLSKDFCESRWCKFELIIAQDRWLNNESEALLLVMLDDLESDHMTRDLRALIRTTTYVMWTDDNLAGQRLFWEKVVNTLRRGY